MLCSADTSHALLSFLPLQRETISVGPTHNVLH